MVHMLYPAPMWDMFDRLFDRLLEDHDRDGMARVGSMNRVNRRSYPQVQLDTTDDGATVAVHLPGMKEADIELSLEADTLTISGKRVLTAPEGAKVLRRERSDIEFTRSLRLPFHADPNRGEATYRDGVLIISIYRQEADKPRRITISSNDPPKLTAA